MPPSFPNILKFRLQFSSDSCSKGPMANVVDSRKDEDDQAGPHQLGRVHPEVVRPGVELLLAHGVDLAQSEGVDAEKAETENENRS